MRNPVRLTIRCSGPLDARRPGSIVINWEAIGAIGEIVGALAVVASLIYLATQIAVQNREARIASMHDISSAHRDSLAAISEGVMADVFDKALDDFDNLSRADTFRVIGFVYRFFRVWEEAYFQHQAGRLEDRMWDSMSRQFSAYLSLVPFRRIWDLRGQYFDPQSRGFVDSLDADSLAFPNMELGDQDNANT